LSLVVAPADGATGACVPEVSSEGGPPEVLGDLSSHTNEVRAKKVEHAIPNLGGLRCVARRANRPSIVEREPAKSPKARGIAANRVRDDHLP
jgi:hypothetical protein